jgi:hypothetical protein
MEATFHIWNTQIHLKISEQPEEENGIAAFEKGIIA